ncbi:LPS-assembly protein LptD [Sphingomonas endolithica]|uniref:LPS-assembly protein LptD n=1 Tax=Sphingomonas endolithica TaxID=2972485 RepID=UPI0021AEDC9B|nr:LPS assembly protein LptD [Sphingomonas sp. ZFBP2030]
MTLRSETFGWRALLLAGAAIPALAATNAHAQTAPAGDPIDFSADMLTTNDKQDRVEASGDVRAKRGEHRLRADSVDWDREAGIVTAIGDIAIDDGKGNRLYADRAVLDDGLQDGTVSAPLVTMKGDRRLAARSGVRKNGITTLDNASYTACHVVDAAGCPKDPFWTITASKIVHDEHRHRISYRNPRLNVLGQPVLWLPGLSHSDGSDEGNASGLLVPDVTYSATKGLEYAQPYYWKTRTDRDLTITPHVYSAVLPMVEARYRGLLPSGAFSIGGSITKASRLPADVLDPSDDGRKGSIRGSIDALARFQLDPSWSIDASLRLASDRSYLRRYDLSGDDRLRSIVTAERIDRDSYFAAAAYGFQILSFSDTLEDQAIAAPVLDYRRRLSVTGLPGTLELNAGGVSLLRDDGQSVARAGTGLTWNARHVDDGGRLWSLTALVKADGYRVTSALDQTPAEYRGAPGLAGRAIAAGALDLRWPLIAPLAGGTQTITPRLQLASSAVAGSDVLPNEDSRAADLDTNSLFALNPLPGQDRWAGGTRLTYGVDWRYDRPNWALTASAGQILFLRHPVAGLRDDVGLSGRTSDVVVDGSLRVGAAWRLSGHARFDDRSGAVRRVDAQASWSTGPAETFVSYTQADRGDVADRRDIGGGGEKIADYEEVTAGLRLRVARYWTASGGAVVNLQGRGKDPLSFGNGFQPVRERLGLAYDDECISVGVSWKREYDTTGNASGNTFRLRFVIKTLGR